MSEPLLSSPAAQAAAELIMSRCDVLAEISETPGDRKSVV